MKECGVDADVVFSDTRKLVLESSDGQFSFFLVKPSDVPTYVEYGIAGFPEMKKQLTSSHLRVATKYVHTAKKLYAARGEDIEIITLHGSIELAPVTGLADVIFDIVQTGSTLKANGLAVLEEVYDISARLVANKVSLKTKADVLLPLIEKMRERV